MRVGKQLLNQGVCAIDFYTARRIMTRDEGCVVTSRDRLMEILNEDTFFKEKGGVVADLSFVDEEILKGEKRYLYLDGFLKSLDYILKFAFKTSRAISETRGCELASAWAICVITYLENSVKEI